MFLKKVLQRLGRTLTERGDLGWERRRVETFSGQERKFVFWKRWTKWLLVGKAEGLPALILSFPLEFVSLAA